MELKVFTLSNGIRLVHQSVASPVAHCGVFIHAGSRDETEKEHGLAHFIEHTIFKGTKKRTVYQVLNRLENVGADLDAYTTKEETCINATFLKEYYARTLELFGDILFNSTFPEVELEREKQVVADEIHSYKDNPAEQIFDDFEDMVFAGHPLGRNILGTVKSLKNFNRKAIFDFISRNYRPENLVLASVGDIDFARLVKMAERELGKDFGFQGAGYRVERRPFNGFKREVREVKKKGAQVHCVLGGEAYGFSDERRFPLALLNNVLGGPIMNSRLSLALRAKHGLTYMNESNYTAFSDCGLIIIYFGTDPVHYEKALSIVFKELKRLREEKLSPAQLRIIKRQLMGQLAIASESNMAAMLAMGKSFLLQDRFEPIESIMRRIEEISAELLIEVANEILEEGRLSRLTFR